MEHENPRPKIASPLVLVVAASLVLGGLAGGTLGWLSATGRIGGAPAAGTSTAKSGTVKVTEDSATVDVVQKVSPAVVSIVVTKDFSKIYGDASPFDLFGFPFVQPPTGKQEVGGGTGFVVSNDGLIVTNKHVVDDPEAEYTVVLNTKQRYDAKVVAQDPTQDIAIVRVEAKDLPVAELGDSDGLKIGQSVIAIGNALGQYQNTVTKGIVSGLARTITAGDASGSSERLENVIQTDAAINPGNSGGPLLNLAGQVVGMNTAVNRSGQLVGFAIPINVVKRDLGSVEKAGKITRAYLGVRYIPIDAEVQKTNDLSVDYGALIQRGESRSEVAVIPGSPADKAGLVENDIILELDGVKLDADHSLAGLLSKYEPGTEISLNVLHSGSGKTVRVTLGEKQ
jgi:serine protease Do